MTKRSKQWSTALAVGTLLLTACSAKLVSTKLPERGQPRTEMKGIVYTLPRTVVKVALPVVLVVTAEGPYGKYSKLFLPGVKARSTARELTFKRATLSTFGEADPDQIYVAQVRGSRALDQSMTFQFTEDGAVTGLKATVTDTTTDILLSTVGALVDVYTRGFLLTDAGDLGDAKNFIRDVLRNRPELIDNFNALTSEEKSVFLKIYEDVSQRQELYRARDAYLEIAKLIDRRRSALLDPDFRVGGFLYDQNVKAIAELVALFEGSREEIIWEGIFEVRPACRGDRPCQESLPVNPLVEYSSDGICKTNNLGAGATPFPVRMRKPTPKPEDEPLCTNKVTLSLVRGPGSQLATELHDRVTNPEEAALYYNVPARMRATLSRSDKVEPVGENDLLIAQMGLVTAMPSRLGGKSVTHDLKLYSSTGALLSYSLVSTPALTTGMVDSLSSSANALLDARKKQAEAEKLEEDKLTKLERQHKLLEYTSKIKLLCATLGIPEDQCPI